MDTVTRHLVDAITEALKAAIAPAVEAIRQLRDATVTEGGTRVVPIATTATRIAGNSPRRRSILLVNTGTVVAEWGFSAGLSFCQGIPINPGDVFVDNGAKPHKGSYYAVTSSAAGELRVAEISDGQDSG